MYACGYTIGVRYLGVCVCSIVNTIVLLCNFIGTVAYGSNSKDMMFAAQNFLSDYKFWVITVETSST